MLTFTEMKKRLKGKIKNLAYFTDDFYSVFIEDYRHAVISSINKTKQEEYQKTKKTEFYLKNGGSYCQFLEEFFSCPNLIKFSIDVMVGPGALISHEYYYFESENLALRWAQANLPDPLFYTDVYKVS